MTSLLVSMPRGMIKSAAVNFNDYASGAIFGGGIGSLIGAGVGGYRNGWRGATKGGLIGLGIGGLGGLGGVGLADLLHKKEPTANKPIIDPIKQRNQPSGMKPGEGFAGKLYEPKTLRQQWTKAFQDKHTPEGNRMRYWTEQLSNYEKMRDKEFRPNFTRDDKGIGWEPFETEQEKLRFNALEEAILDAAAKAGYKSEQAKILPDDFQSDDPWFKSLRPGFIHTPTSKREPLERAEAEFARMNELREAYGPALGLDAVH